MAYRLDWSRAGKSKADGADRSESMWSDRCEAERRLVAKRRLGAGQSIAFEGSDVLALCSDRRGVVECSGTEPDSEVTSRCYVRLAT